VTGISIRRPRPHELDAFVRCVEAGFAVRLTPGKHEELVTDLDSERTLAAFDGLELVGTLAGYPAELTVPGPVVTAVLSLAEVSVLPTHRRRGVLTTLLDAALRAGRGRGDQLAVLASSEGGIYGRFGFASATSHQRFVVERARACLRDRLGARPAGRIALLELSEALEALPLVFDAARRQRPGELGRSAAYWEQLLVAPEEATTAPVRFVAAYEQDGLLDGYAIYSVVTDPETGSGGSVRRAVELEECCTTSDAAYVTLFSYLLGLDLTSRLRTRERPVDEPLRHMLEDPRALQTTELGDGLWIRVLDVVGALGTRRDAADGKVGFELVDEFCPWNAGRYVLEVETGTARVASTSTEVDLVLDAAALAACYLGGTSPVTLRTAGAVVEHVAGAAQQLERLLAWPPEPFCSTT